MFLYSKWPAWCADSKSGLGFLVHWTIRTPRPFNYVTFLDYSSYTVTEPKACIKIRKVSHLSWQCNSFLVYSKINVVMSSLSEWFSQLTIFLVILQYSHRLLLRSYSHTKWTQIQPYNHTPVVYLCHSHETVKLPWNEKQTKLRLLHLHRWCCRLVWTTHTRYELFTRNTDTTWENCFWFGGMSVDSSPLVGSSSHLLIHYATCLQDGGKRCS